MYLLHQKGFRTDWMDQSFKTLGATARERHGSVESWVRSLDDGSLRILIADLKERGGKNER